MVRLLVPSLMAMIVLPMAAGAPLPKRAVNLGGILVLDDCDDQYKGKEEYKDNLTLIDSDGSQSFRVSGFNNCQSIGCARMLAVDLPRKHIWALENVAGRIRRFDLLGKVTLTIPDVKASAIAVDPANGNVWALKNNGMLNAGKTVVYDAEGKWLADHDVTGFDIAYDRKSKAFWIVGCNLTKVLATTGETLFSRAICQWSASSLDIDQQSGAAWVAVREHRDLRGSANRLLKFDAEGKELLAVELGKKMPFHVSADPGDGGVWVAHLRESVERFSAAGKSEAEHSAVALAVQACPSGGDVWVVTTTDTQRMSPKGDVTKRVRHAGKTSIAWITAME